MIDKDELLKEIIKNVELSIYNTATSKRVVTICYPCSCISRYFTEGEVKEQVELRNGELGAIAYIPIEDIKRYGYINPCGYEEEFIIYI